ncbi:MAG: hypothetical protein IIC88_02725 [Chloroflexi bacterium]|nr:hypothetical protein [Chloroflexota bacterium]
MMSEAGPERSPEAVGLRARLRQAPVQFALLAALLLVVVAAIIITDLATGGDAEPPPLLGENIARTPGAVVFPTLPPLPTATPFVTPTLSSGLDAQERDALRIREMSLLQIALAVHLDRFGEYPNTEGQIQSLCVFEDLDKGCELKRVLDEGQEELLQDPLGDPLANGYWYVSDGGTYTIWMLRESADAGSEFACSEAPPFLLEKGALFCVTVSSAAGP